MDVTRRDYLEMTREHGLGRPRRRGWVEVWVGGGGRGVGGWWVAKIEVQNKGQHRAQHEGPTWRPTWRPT